MNTIKESLFDIYIYVQCFCAHAKLGELAVKTQISRNFSSSTKSVSRGIEEQLQKQLEFDKLV